MKKWFVMINFILAAIVVALDFCYALVRDLWLKGVTSAGFVVIGIVNLIYFLLATKEDKKFPVIMLVALVLCLVADVILEIEFITGALLFAMGHVAYFLAYSSLIKFKWTDLISSVVIFVPVTLFMTLAPIFNYGSVAMELVCIFYALIISCMVGKAISNTIRDLSIVNLIILVGSILFMFSDIMLLFGVFGDAPRVCNALCIGTYYPAQIFLGVSLFAKAIAVNSAEK